MRVPYRKPGEFTMEKQDPHLTVQAIEKLKEELERLEKRTLKRALEEMQLAASNGDFSENAAYQLAKGRVRGINARILHLKSQIAKAIPIEVGSDDGKVRIGATVVVDVKGKQKTYQILGAHETDPATGKISHLSPLGKILLGHKAGDIVELNNGDNIVVYKIIEVK